MATERKEEGSLERLVDMEVSRKNLGFSGVSRRGALLYEGSVPEGYLARQGKN
jgi:hypothetical protein